MLSSIGLAASFYVARLACIATKEPPNLFAIGMIVSIALYTLLRMGGKTPIGITYDSHLAAKGHPILSANIFLVSLFAWIIAFFVRSGS